MGDGQNVITYPEAGSIWFRAQGDAAPELEHVSVLVKGIHPVGSTRGDEPIMHLMVWFTLIEHGDKVYSLDVATFMEDFMELFGADSR